MKHLLLLFLLFSSTIINAQVNNDECIAATILQVNPGLATTLFAPGNVQGATASAEANTCGGFDDDDVWYQFTATNTIHKIQLQNITGSTTNLNHVLYEGSDCSTLIQKYCSDPNTSIANNLIIGQTYKLRVYTATQAAGQTTSFTVSVTTPPVPPANDSVQNAVSLTVNPFNDCTNTVTGTLYQATVDCPAMGSAEDVWYEFVATTPKVKITVEDLNGSLSQLTYKLYSGNSCSNLSAMQGGIYNSAPVLTIGQTYKIRVSSWSGASVAPSSFSICLSVGGPVNDECAFATALPVNSGGSCSQTSTGSFTGATYIGLNSFDVWYDFIATGNTHTIDITNFTGNPNFTHTVYSGNCGTLTQLYQSVPESSSYTGFVAGQLYKIKVVYNFGTNSPVAGLTFDICVGTPVPVANDECINAEALTINSDTSCTAYTSGTFQNSGPGGTTYDVWYQFTATSTNHSLNVFDVTTNLSVTKTIYTGTCSNLTAYYQTTNPLSSLGGLTIGQNYKVKLTLTLAANQPPPTATFKICVGGQASAPVNDWCSGATIIPINAGTECTTLASGTVSLAVGSGVANTCTGSPDDDVWFQFTATNSIHTIQLLNTTGNTLAYSIYASANCNSLGTALYCGTETGGQYSFVVGQVYKMRVYTSTSATGQTATFNICITTPPPHDNCAAAIPLTVNPGTECVVSTQGTLAGASPSNINTCLGTYAYKDVWYEFTATGPLHYITLTGSSYVCSVYSGNCSSLVQVACDTYMLTNLTAGQTYKIKVFNFSIYADPSIPFTICVTTPPASPSNNECANAVPMAINPTMEGTQSTPAVMTSATISPESSCYSTLADVWFEFTATQARHVISTSVSVPRAVYSGTCNSLTQIFCNTGQNTYLENLTIGQTYKVRTFSGNALEGDTVTFTIKVLSPPPAPANDECVNATILTVNTGSVCTVAQTATTSSATDSANPSPAGNVNNDVWFEFTATASAHYLTFSNITGWLYLTNAQLYSGSCGAMTYIQSFPTSSTGVLSGLTVGQVYKLRVSCGSIYEGDAEPNSFDICITTPATPPINDNCTNAIAIPVNTDMNCSQFASGTVVGATGSPEPAICGNSDDDDVWFTFTATQPIHHIIMAPDNVSVVLQLTVYTGTGCGTNLTALQCSGLTTTLENLVAGQTYTIRVRKQTPVTSPGTDFTICIKTPAVPVNDNAANAIEVPVNNDYTCTVQTTGTMGAATQSQESSTCTNAYSYIDDVWYKFVATSTTHNISVSYTETSAPYVTLYSGTGTALTQIHCNNGSNTAMYSRFFQQLIVGETYWIRISSGNDNSDQTPFTICIRSLVTPANDACSNSIPIPVNTGMTCEQSIQGTSFGATSSPESGTCTGDDVWYEFTATATTHVITINNFVGASSSTFSLYGGNSCSVMQTIACTLHTSNSHAFNNLIVGDTYKIRVNNPSLFPVTFTVCIKTPPACPEAIPFTTGYDSYVFANQTNIPTVSGYVGCLQTSPNPQWFVMQIDNPGDLVFQITGNSSFDPYGAPDGTFLETDYIVWGPYGNPADACNNLNNTQIISCNYEDSDIEDFTIPSTQAGEYYIVMITNYSNQNGFIKFQQIGGTGTVEVEAPIGDAIQEFEPGVTLGDIAVEGENIQWYDNPGSSAGRSGMTNDNPLPLSTPVVSGVTYYASQTKYGIESIMRLAVTVYLTTDAPEINESSDIFICSDNDFAVVNLTTVIPEILDGLTAANYTVSFHHTEADAENGLQSIENPAAYATTIPDSESIFVRVTEIINPGNFAVTNFNVLVEHFEVSEPSVYSICEPSTDGFTTFDLTTKTQEITAGCTGCTIAYYAGTGGTNPIADPGNYNNTVNQQTIHVIVTSANGCVASTTLTLEVLDAPVVPSLPVLFTCDGSYDLTENESLYNNNYIISYHTSENDADNDANAITNTTAYTESGSVWVRVESAGTACYATSEQQLLVNDLMSASVQINGQDVTVVMSSNGQYQYKLDSGDYQVNATFNGVAYGEHNISIMDGCNNILVIAFDVIPDAPTGEASQTYVEGETLADIEVNGLGILWYESSTDGEPLSPDTPLMNGITYYASQTITGIESTDRLAVTVNLALGISDNAFVGFVLYPNPVKDILNISNNNDISEIAIYNLLGQLLYTTLPKTDTIQIDMSGYQSGVYLIVIKSGSQEKAVKVNKK